MKTSKAIGLKEILVCADDYSLNEAVSEGILILASTQRINAVSCLVNLSSWQEQSQELKMLNNNCLLGLHLNLTEGQPLSVQWKNIKFPRLRTLLQQCYLGRLDKNFVLAEIHAQLDAFTQRIGRNPDFIDGHQHVHQFPIVREALITAHQQRNLSAFCRNTSYKNRSQILQFNLKRQAIAWLGGNRFDQLLKKAKIASNTSFAGFYPFAKAENYRYYFKQFLNLIQSGGLIICHPGLHSKNSNDPLHLKRQQELNYLISDDYFCDLNEADCQLIKTKMAES